MKKWIVISSLFILAVIVSGSIVYAKAVKPLKKAEEVAVRAANKKMVLNHVEDVEIYNGEKTYYILKGKNKNNANVIVWVSEDGKQVSVRKEQDGISKDQAVAKLLQETNPKEIVSVKLAMLKNKQCWEIYYLSHNNLINYYYVDFETGEWLRKIENM